MPDPSVILEFSTQSRIASASGFYRVVSGYGVEECRTLCDRMLLGLEQVGWIGSTACFGSETG